MRRLPFIALLTIIPTPYPNTLYIDPNTSLGEISPLVYGSSYGPWIARPVDELETTYNSGSSFLYPVSFVFTRPVQK